MTRIIEWIKSNVLLTITYCIYIAFVFIIANQQAEIEQLSESNTRLFIIKDASFHLLHDLDSILQKRDSTIENRQNSKP